MNELKYF